MAENLELTTKFNADIGDFLKGVKALKGSFEKIVSDTENVTKKFGESKTSMANFSKTMTKAVTVTSEKINVLKTNITSISTSTGKLSSKIETVQNKVSAFSTAVGSSTTSVNKFAKGLTVVFDNLTKSASKFVEQVATIDNYKESLKKSNKEVAALKKELNGLIAAQKSHQKELTKNEASAKLFKEQTDLLKVNFQQFGTVYKRVLKEFKDGDITYKVAVARLKKLAATQKEVKASSEALLKAKEKEIETAKKVKEAYGHLTSAYNTVMSKVRAGILTYDQAEKALERHAKRLKDTAKIEKDSAKALADKVKASKVLKTELNSLLIKYKEYGITAKKLIDIYKQEGNSLKQTKAVLAAYKREQDSVNAAVKRLTNSYRKKAFESESVQRKLSMLTQEMRKNGLSFNKADAAMRKHLATMKLAERQMTTWEKRVKTFRRAFSTLIDYMGAGMIIMQIAEAFRVGAEAIVDYDQALKNLQAIAKSTDAQTELMGQTILDVARETKFSSTEIADGMVLLAQSGLDATETIQAIGNVSKLATGTLSDMSTSVDLVTSTMNSFGLKAKDSGRIADVFANSVNRSKLTIDKLRTAFNYIGPLAAQANISLEQTAATMAVLANNGLRASTIGTNLRQVFSRLVAPSKKIREAMQAAGIALRDIDPRAVGLEKALDNLSDAMTGANGQAVDLGKAFELFGLRGATAITVMVKNRAQIARYTELMGEVGAATFMAAKQQEGLGVKLKNLGDRLKNVAIALGESGLTGIFENIIDILRETATVVETIFNSAIAKATIFIVKWTSVVLLLRLAFLKLAPVLAGFIFQVGVFLTAIKFDPVILLASALIALGVAVVSTTAYLIAGRKSAEELSEELQQAAMSADTLVDALVATNGVQKDFNKVVQRAVLEDEKLIEKIKEITGKTIIATITQKEWLDALNKIRMKEIAESIDLASEAYIRQIKALRLAAIMMGFNNAQTEDLNLLLEKMRLQGGKAAKSANELTGKIDALTAKYFDMAKMMGLGIKETNNFILAKIKESGILTKNAIPILNVAIEKYKELGESQRIAAKKGKVALDESVKGSGLVYQKWKDYYEGLDYLQKTMFLADLKRMNDKVAAARKNFHDLIDIDKLKGKEKEKAAQDLEDQIDAIEEDAFQASRKRIHEALSETEKAEIKKRIAVLKTQKDTIASEKDSLEKIASLRNLDIKILEEQQKLTFYSAKQLRTMKEELIKESSNKMTKFLDKQAEKEFKMFVAAEKKRIGTKAESNAKIQELYNLEVIELRHKLKKEGIVGKEAKDAEEALYQKHLNILKKLDEKRLKTLKKLEEDVIKSKEKTRETILKMQDIAEEKFVASEEYKRLTGEQKTQALSDFRVKNQAETDDKLLALDKKYRDQVKAEYDIALQNEKQALDQSVASKKITQEEANASFLATEQSHLEHKLQIAQKYYDKLKKNESSKADDVVSAKKDIEQAESALFDNRKKQATNTLNLLKKSHTEQQKEDALTYKKRQLELEKQVEAGRVTQEEANKVLLQMEKDHQESRIAEAKKYHKEVKKNINTTKEDELAANEAVVDAEEKLYQLRKNMGASLSAFWREKSKYADRISHETGKLIVLEGKRVDLWDKEKDSLTGLIRKIRTLGDQYIKLRSYIPAEMHQQVIDKLNEESQAFYDVEKKAKEAGLSVDVYNKTLEDLEEEVQGRIDGMNDFRDSMKDLSEKFKESIEGLKKWKDRLTDAAQASSDKFDESQAKIKAFVKDMPASLDKLVKPLFNITEKQFEKIGINFDKLKEKAREFTSSMQDLDNVAKMFSTEDVEEMEVFQEKLEELYEKSLKAAEDYIAELVKEFDKISEIRLKVDELQLSFNESITVLSQWKDSVKDNLSQSKAEFETAQQTVNGLMSTVSSMTNASIEDIEKFHDRMQAAYKNSLKAAETYVKGLVVRFRELENIKESFEVLKGSIEGYFVEINRWTSEMSSTFSRVNTELTIGNNNLINFAQYIAKARGEFRSFWTAPASGASAIELELNAIIDSFGRLESATDQAATAIQNDFRTLLNSLKSSDEELSGYFSRISVSSMDSVETILGSTKKMINELTSASKESIVNNWAYFEKSYQSIIDFGTKVIDTLKEKWEELSQKIEEIQGQITELHAQTARDIIDIQRGLMTELEKWEDERKEFTKTLAEAEKLAAQGSYEAAQALYEKARELAKQLATEVKDSEGEVVKSLTENSELAIKLLNKVAASSTRNLTGYQTALLNQQTQIGTQINATMTTLQGFSGEFGRMQSGMATAQGQVTSAIDQTIASLQNSTSTMGVFGNAMITTQNRIATAISNTITALDRMNNKIIQMGQTQWVFGNFGNEPVGINPPGRFARGGMLGGYGGGDRNPALLEDGEYVEPKESVRLYSPRFFEALKNRTIPAKVIKALMSSIKGYKDGGLVNFTPTIKPVQKLQEGGMVGDGGGMFSGQLHTINLNINNSKHTLFGDGNTVNSLVKDLRRTQLVTA